MPGLKACEDFSEMTRAKVGNPTFVVPASFFKQGLWSILAVFYS